jgi:predicted nucleic acid-binding protein
MEGLIDTSVLIAEEQARPLGPGPTRAAISVLTLAELQIGALAARDLVTRARRTRTLAKVESELEALPVDDVVARRYAEIVSEARHRGKRFTVIDALIGATAAAHDLPLYTQDAGFDGMPGVSVIHV